MRTGHLATRVESTKPTEERGTSPNYSAPQKCTDTSLIKQSCPGEGGANRWMSERARNSMTGAVEIPVFHTGRHTRRSRVLLDFLVGRRFPA